MQVDLNKERVKTMVETLRGALPQGPVSQSQTYEAVSKMFGYKNWDTFSALLQRSVPDANLTAEMETYVSDYKYWQEPPRLHKPFTLYTGAFQQDEYSDGPRWAKMTITQELIQQVHALQLICLQNDLAHVATYDQYAEWGSTDEFSLRDDVLYVNKEGFWFRAYEKHSDSATETRRIVISRLFEVISPALAKDDRYLAWADGVLFHSNYSARDFARGLLDDDVISINEGTIDQMPG